MMKFSLHHILHACFHNLIISLITKFHKIEFTVIKVTFHVSCSKHACFDTQNIYAMRKNNKNKYPCEFNSLV
jgi:hypothetical protein